MTSLPVRLAAVCCLSATYACASAKPSAPVAEPARVAAAAAVIPERAVRRDIPLWPGIRRAYRAGTRDSTGAPGPKYWQQKVDYVIEASLDPSTSRLTGSERITLHNTTPDTLSTIVLRLYQNYFTPRVERNDYVTDITDGMIVERVAVNGAQVPLADEKRYELNDRIATITPASPVLPGQSVNLEVAWHFTVPAVDTAVRGQRMGRFGNYLYQIAQWYPQVAMYDDMRGWDYDQYLGNEEFHNQFGSFDVKITAPGGWLLGATGDLQNPAEVFSKRTRDRLALAMEADTTILVVKPEERGSSATAPGKTLTWHYKAPLVNDFAFAVSRDYAYDATHATIPGKGKIPVHVLYLAQHTRYRTLNTAQFGRRALEEHSKWLFPYEFSQGTIADGPETGMEYPMIIFNGSSLGVTSHEFAHQWFPMMVGSNETRYGFMDEGFVGYVTSFATATISNTPRTAPNGASYRRIAGSEIEAPMMWPTNFGGPGANLATYTKAPLALYALGGVVGDSAVKTAFAEYASKWKYKHASPWDFFMSMNKSLGQDLGWFWHGWFFTNYTFDQAIESVRIEDDMAIMSIRDKADLAMPVILKLEFDTGPAQTVTMPADVWFPGHRSFLVRTPLLERRLKTVTVDPDNRFQDLDVSNNVWRRE